MHRVNPIPINSHINYVFKAFWRAQHSLAADDFRRSVQIAECFQLYNRIAIEFLNNFIKILSRSSFRQSARLPSCLDYEYMSELLQNTRRAPLHLLI